jgi:hypothetical protein
MLIKVYSCRASTTCKSYYANDIPRIGERISFLLLGEKKLMTGKIYAIDNVVKDDTLECVRVYVGSL